MCYWGDVESQFNTHLLAFGKILKSTQGHTMIIICEDSIDAHF